MVAESSLVEVDVLISVGSNIDAAANTRAGVKLLRQKYGELQLSSVVETSAVGFDGDNFLNCVVGFRTSLPAADIAEGLKDIERICGRRRVSQKFSARTLDLDLLLYGVLTLDDQGMDVPRREIEKYPFVLAPLAELMPLAKYPRAGNFFGQTYAEMWANFSRDRAGLTTVDFDWDIEDESSACDCD